MDDKQNQQGLNNVGLDFQKMNEVLANPNFQQWYYNQTQDSYLSTNSMNIEGFVQSINEYLDINDDTNNM